MIQKVAWSATWLVLVHMRSARAMSGVLKEIHLFELDKINFVYYYGQLLC